jgi:hypothetical protein
MKSRKINLYFFFFIFCLFIFVGCDNEDNKISVLHNNDSTKYFLKFDFYSFTPSVSLESNIDVPPYFEIWYNKGTISKILIHGRSFIDIYYVDKIEGQYRLCMANPEDIDNSYLVCFVRKNSILSYSYCCNYYKSFSGFNSIPDSGCYLTKIEKYFKNIEYSYIFDCNDSITKMESLKFDTSHNALINQHNLISYYISSTNETNSHYIFSEVGYFRNTNFVPKYFCYSSSKNKWDDYNYVFPFYCKK